ncbi:hypothetical protein FHT87_005232 [Rhizobium sp. BK316]|uniref:hypothetical protein n=1 Tax=Rhizobium sp. BK316 TaxID=2587053 RepID=UPI00161EEEE4|nr:hypothetical protein [Rhizobium sp. BK316]MBB3411279.1 hypothetical protein [Rhizobium sp. BK316]
MFEHRIKHGIVTLCIVKSEDRKAAINAAVKRVIEFQRKGFTPRITNVDAETWALVEDVHNWPKTVVQ